MVVTGSKNQSAKIGDKMNQKDTLKMCREFARKNNGVFREQNYGINGLKTYCIIGTTISNNCAELSQTLSIKGWQVVCENDALEQTII